MRKIKSLIILIYTLLSINVVNLKAQQDEKYSQKKYSIIELQTDFKILRKALENVQPSLYRYTNKNEMDLFLDNTFKSINKPMTELEFYKCLLHVIARVRNGHSHIEPSDAYLKYSKNNITKLSLKIEIVDQHAYIIENYSSDSSITKGSEILSINGIPFYSIYSQILPLLPSDGYSLAFKHAKLALNFDFHYSLFYNTQDSFSLELLPPYEKSTIQKRIAALLEKDIYENKTSKYNLKNSNKVFNLEITKDSIGILTIKNFRNEEFKSFVDNTFINLNNHKTKHLIIDVRDNRGGNDDNGVYLYSYLSDKLFDYYSLMETKLEPNQTNIPCIEYFKESETIHQVIKLISKDKNNRNIIVTPDTAAGFVKPGVIHNPKQNCFRGDVYVLINGLSFSVTSDFCAIAYKNGRAKFVGSETGGAFYGNTSGYAYQLILPITKLNVTINLIEYRNAVENSKFLYGRGVLPDFEVHPSALDIYNGIDTEMEYTLNLIRSNK